MVYRYLFLFVILTFSKILFSQENDFMVSRFKTDFPNSDVVIANLIQNIELNFNKTTKTFEVIEETVYHIMSLNPMVKVQMPIFFDNNTEIISTKISKGSLNKTIGNYHPKGIFHSDMKLCLLQSYIPKSGELRILTVKRKHLDIHHYPVIAFGINHYPVKNSKVEVMVPENFNVEFVPGNTNDYNYTFESTILPKKTIYTFTCSDIPSYEEEKEKPPLSYYSPKLFVIPKNYKFDKEVINFFSDLQHLYLWCKDKADRTQNNIEIIKPVVNKIIEGKSNDIEKIKGIYNWVQNNIRYIAFEEGLAGYIPDNAQNVLNNKYGDCKGMANLLKVMLTIAGFDARIAWIGTRDIKEGFSVHNLATSNHVICVLLYNNKKYYLDATDNHSYYGIDSENISGKQVLIENGATYILDTIPLPTITQSRAESQAFYKIQNQEITGNLNLTFHGDLRSYMLNKLSLSETDEKNKVLEKIVTRSSSKVTAKNIVHSGITNTDSIFSIKAEVNIKGLLTKIDNQLFFTPDLFDEISDLSAPENKKLPQYFNFRQHRKYISKTQIPQDYSVLKLPENFIFKNDYITFTIKYTNQNNTIEYQKEWILHSHLIPNNQLAQWNNDLKTIKKALSQPIILIKP